MPEFILSAKAPSGKNAKLKIAASSLESAIQKAEKNGYTSVTEYDGTLVKTEKLLKRESSTISKKKKTIFEQLMSIHWAIRYGIVFSIALIIFAVSYKSKAENQKDDLKKVAIEIGGQKYADAYYHMANLMPSSADEASSFKSSRGKRSSNYNKAQFIEAIRNELKSQISRLEKNHDPGYLFNGYWVKHYEKENFEIYEYYKFNKDNTYDVVVFADDGDRREVGRKKSSVQISDKKITWESDGKMDPDEIESMSDRFMILDELDGNYTCWMHVDKI